jgi:hypothetical protein
MRGVFGSAAGDSCRGRWWWKAPADQRGSIQRCGCMLHGSPVQELELMRSGAPDSTGNGCTMKHASTSLYAPATCEAMDTLYSDGMGYSVRLLGTPAEEGGGGKLLLINAGAYKDVDEYPIPSEYRVSIASQVARKAAIELVAIRLCPHACSRPSWLPARQWILYTLMGWGIRFGCWGLLPRKVVVENRIPHPIRV